MSLWGIVCKNNLIYLLLGLLFLASCNSKQKEYGENVFFYSEFPQEIKLEGEVIEIDTALLRYPFRIRVDGDKAIIMDLHGPDHYGHLFHYPSFRYLSSFGRRGESPAEMLSMENFRFHNQEVCTLDANKNEITSFSFSSSGDSLFRKEAVALDENILRPLDFAIYNDTTFIIPDYSGQSRFCWVNREGKLIDNMGSIPSVNEDAIQNARPALAQAWRSFVDYNSHNGILAAVTQLGEVIEIYNLKDSTCVVQIGEYGEPEFEITDGYGIPTGIMGFSDVQVTDKAIYAVFHGTEFKEIARKRGSLPDGGKYIYVFSLKGEPLYKYVLDHYISGIWVDEANKIILATDVNSDQPIVKFHLRSCKHTQKEEVKDEANCKVEFSLHERQDNIVMSSFIDSVQVLSLNLPSDVIIGRATRVFFYNSHIFVLDRMQQKIFHFNADGTFLGELYRRGNGLGEYNGLHSCMVKDDILYVFDKMGQNILLYDFSFKFIRSFHCEQWVENLTLLSDGSFLCFTPNFVYNAPNGIWQMDCEGKVIKLWHEFKGKYPYVSSEWNPFYATSTKEIGIRCPIRNTFYRFLDTNVNSVMKWNVKEKTTLDFPGIESCLAVKEGFWICPIFVDADEWVFGIWGEYNGRTSELFSLYSKCENKMFVSSSLKVDVGNLSLMGNPVSSNLPNVMVTIVDEEVIMASKSSMLDPNKILSNNKVFLVIYRFLKTTDN